MMESPAGQADHPGELRGDDDDVARVRQTFIAEPERFGGETGVELLVALIDRRREELEGEAIVLGQRLFQDSPKGFACHMKGYWKVWRKQGRLVQQVNGLGP